MIRRSFTVFTLFFLVAGFLPTLAFPTPACARQGEVFLSAQTGAFSYTTGQVISLHVELGLTEELRSRKMDLELHLYPSALTRSYLASFRGNPRRSPILTRKLGTITPQEQTSRFTFELDPSSMGVTAGIYPFEVRLVDEGEVLGSDRSYLVIMRPDAGYPLNLSLIWTLDFLPPLDALGNPLDGSLNDACSASPSDPGFLYSLVMTLLGRPNMRSTLVVPVFVYQQLENIAKTPAEGTSESEGADKILTGLSALASEGRVDFLNTSYAFCDLDVFQLPDWESQVRAQVDLGLSGTGLKGTPSTGFVTPNFRVADATLQMMAERGMEFTVVSQETLQYSEAGRSLLQGTTISQPLRFVNSKGTLIKGFVLDEALYDFLKNPGSGDARHLVQEIVAELAVLQREKPYAIHSCVLAFPSSFLPQRDFLESLYDALEGCPWLQVRRLQELNQDQFPLEGVAVKVPDSFEAPSDYLRQLATLRDDASSLSRAVVPQDHPLPGELQRLVLMGMNHRFSEDTDLNATQNYLNSLRNFISGQVSRISISRKRSVTLSSTEGNLSVDINSDLDFPIRATLRMSNPSLTFPQGNSLEIRIEPRENRYLFPVSTHRRGSFLVDIVLEADGLIIDRTTITLNTSIINTLAVILLACLAGAIGLALALRRLTRSLRGGKHARGGSGNE